MSRIAAVPAFDLAGLARTAPGAIALIDEHGGTITWAQLARRARRVRARIDVLAASLGLGLDDAIPFVAPARVSTFVLIHAAIAAGRPLLPIHPRLGASEVDALRAALGASVPVDVDALAHPEGDAAGDAGGDAGGDAEGGTGSAALGTRQGALPDDERALAVLATSGTTATPKGVLLSRRAFAAAAAASAVNTPLGASDRWLSCMPLAHAGGLSIVTRALAAGAGVVLLPRFDPGSVLEAVRVHRATHISVVPTMLRGLLDHPDAAALSGLRAMLVGGAACPAPLLAAARERGVPALATYGLTEACAQVTTQPLTDRTRRPEGDSGLPLAGVAIAVRAVGSAGGGAVGSAVGSAVGGAVGSAVGSAAAEDEPRLLAADAEGEIVVRGPTMMSGYVGASPLAPGAWHPTGDFGVVRGDGRLVVTARRSDLIVTGGENVAPAAVEAALTRHAAVREAVVFGVDDARWGQVVATVIVLATGVDPAIVLGEALAPLAPHARPRLAVVTEGPLLRTSKGEPDRALARARWAGALRPVR